MRLKGDVLERSPRIGELMNPVTYLAPGAPTGLVTHRHQIRGLVLGTSPSGGSAEFFECLQDFDRLTE